MKLLISRVKEGKKKAAADPALQLLNGFPIVKFMIT